MSLKSISFQSQPPIRKHDTKEIKRALDTLPGVTAVSVNENVGHITVDYDNSAVNLDRISKKLSQLGISFVKEDH